MDAGAELRTEEQAIEVGGEEADVVERGGRHAVQDRRDAVQDEHRRGVRDEQPDWMGEKNVIRRKSVAGLM